MNKQKIPLKEILAITVGEAVVSALVVAVYALIVKFTHIEFFENMSFATVTHGVLLGSAVTLANYIILSLMTNKVINEYLKERGTREMTEEEAAEFTAKHAGRVQAQMKLSFIIRIVVMIVTLILAGVLPWFEILSTVIPLLAFRPILTVASLIERKGDKQ